MVRPVDPPAGTRSAPGEHSGGPGYPPDFDRERLSRGSQTSGVAAIVRLEETSVRWEPARAASRAALRNLNARAPFFASNPAYSALLLA